MTSRRTDTGYLLGGRARRLSFSGLSAFLILCCFPSPLGPPLSTSSICSNSFIKREWPCSTERCCLNPGHPTCGNGEGLGATSQDQGKRKIKSPTSHSWCFSQRSKEKHFPPSLSRDCPGLTAATAPTRVVGGVRRRQDRDSSTAAGGGTQKNRMLT